VFGDPLISEHRAMQERISQIWKFADCGGWLRKKKKTTTTTTTRDE